jgi:hypothetical protein
VDIQPINAPSLVQDAPEPAKEKSPCRPGRLSIPATAVPVDVTAKESKSIGGIRFRMTQSERLPELGLSWEWGRLTPILL